MTVRPGPVRPAEQPVPPAPSLPPDGPPGEPPPVSPYAKSEATRLLCAGVHLDPDFRRRVIAELVEHDERSVPPSLGFDLVTVLAHALRARALEIRTGAVLAAIWAAFFCAVCWPLFQHPPSSSYWKSYGQGLSSGYYGDSYGQESASDSVLGTLSHFLTPYLANFAVLYALVTLVSWFAKPAEDRARALAGPAGSQSAARKAVGGLRSAVPVITQILYWTLALLTLGDSAPYGVLFPLLLAATVGGHRLLIAQTVRRELTRDAFRRQPPRPLPDRPRYRALHAAIATEQYSQLVVYDPADPFLGSGIPHRPWSFALELKRRKTGPVAPEGSLTARAVLERVLPLLADLRQASADTSLDRLKDIEIDHLVYLPYGPARGDVPREPEEVARHVAEAVDEGGEQRRYFLRVRVGAWDEQVVLTVQLRVHTQGNLLVLEVVPHVLGPVRRDYELRADAIAQWGTRLQLGRPAVSAFTAGPAALRSLLHPGGPAGGAAESTLVEAARPVVSLRELVASSTVSLFQELDASRYLKTIEERIIDGVRVALEQMGYETGRFEQTVVQVMEGGIHIGSMSGGAVATNGGTASAGVTPPAGGQPS
ncbi:MULTISPECIES: hypothetical protein [Streptomyces]|uniref:hypothetical protein n=1 Tax=Streptomyces TaxID=1883 RepID=UPI0007C80FC1|nr:MULTISPECIES: hypothetical protein [Streptomyces]